MVTFANLGSIRLPSLKFVRPSPSEDTAHLVCQLSIYNSFPVIRTTIAKNRQFYVPRPSFFVCPGAPLRQSRETLHEWKDNSVLAKPLAAYTHLSSIVSQLFEPQMQKIAVFTYRSPHFVSPGDAPAIISNMLHGWKDNSMLVKPLAACTYLSSIVSELYDA